MRNLKKTLAVVLAFAMILSMGLTSMAAYSDVEAGTKVSEAVGILSNLNILTGFEDGTFKPDETVTRAQMAAIICRTLGYEDQAQSSMGTTVFNDVAADHWASGYINVAQAQQIINGYGDGNYGPEDQVTYEQAVKMIVSALGYDLAAQSKGGYPTGYLAIASAEGITKSANGKVGDAAARGTIAILVYNSLEVRLMDQASWSTGSDGDKYEKTDDTILSKYLEVLKVEGVVTKTPFATYESKGFDADMVPEMTIDGKEFYYNKGVEETKSYSDTVDCSLVDADSLLGKYVVAYIGADEDDNTGNVMVYAVSEKQNKNVVTTVASTQLVDSTDTKYFNNAKQVCYREVGSTRVIELDLEQTAAEFKVYENFGTSTFTNASTTANLATILQEGGMAQFISNDNDDAIEYVIITAFDEEGVIENVTNEDGVIMFDLFYGDLADIDTEDEDELTVVYKDGALATAADLAANDTVSTVNVHKTVKVLYASSATVTGAVESHDDEVVTIGGTDYKVGLQYSGDASLLKDKEGIFFLNVGGIIAHDEADSTASGNYGVVLAVDYEDGITDGYVMQVVLQDGTVAEYEVSSKVAYTKADGSALAVGDGLSKDDVAAAAVASGITGATVTANASGFTTKNLTSTNAQAAVYKFTVKNGEITKIKEVESSTEVKEYTSSDVKKYDAESMSYGSYEFDESSIVFAIDHAKGATQVTDDDIAVGGVSSFIADEDDSLALILFTEKNKDVVTFAIGFGLTASIPEESAAIIVSAVKNVTYDDDEAIQVTGIQAGEEVTYIIYDENSGYTSNPENIEKGDVILVSAATAEGVVEDCKILLDISAKTAAAGIAADESANTFALLGGFYNDDAAATSSKFFIDKDVTIPTTPSATTWAASGDGITMKTSANYTLVDYTDGEKNPVIEKKNPGTSLFSKRYPAYVFVRVYDDVLTEVVVYRYDEDKVLSAQGTGFKVADPVIKFNDDKTKATITCATEGATIMYKLNSGEFAKYTEEITVTAGDVVQAYATKTACTTSDTASETVPTPAPAA